MILTAATMLFANGQSGSQAGASSYKRDPNLNPPGVFPINKTTVPLKIGIQQNAQVEDWKTNGMPS